MYNEGALEMKGTRKKRASEERSKKGTAREER